MGAPRSYTLEVEGNGTGGSYGWKEISKMGKMGGDRRRLNSSFKR
jgi:hypothetical protein